MEKDAAIILDSSAKKHGPRGRPFDEDKSKKIIQATWKILSQEGYDGLTYDAVAKEVGSNRATIYRRYPSKAKLVQSVMRETLYSLRPDEDTNISPRDAICNLVQIGIDYLADYRGRAILNVATIAHKSPELAEVFNLHLNAITPYYEKQFRRIVPDATSETIDFAMNTLIGSFFYHIVVRRININKEQIDIIVDQAINIVKTTR